MNYNFIDGCLTISLNNSIIMANHRHSTTRGFCVKPNNNYDLTGFKIDKEDDYDRKTLLFRINSLVIQKGNSDIVHSFPKKCIENNGTIIRNKFCFDGNPDTLEISIKDNFSTYNFICPSYFTYDKIWITLHWWNKSMDTTLDIREWYKQEYQQNENDMDHPVKTKEEEQIFVTI